jgi:hypothetical protein
VKTQLVSAWVSGAATDTTVETGWSLPFSGPPGFEHLAPTEAENASQVSQPIGQQAAEEIAVQLGLRKTVAILASPTGQVPYSEFASAFQ